MMARRPGRVLTRLARGLACFAALACGTDSSNAPRTVASVRVSPPTLVLVEGQDTALTATALDARRSPVRGASTTWQVEDTAVARVGADGIVIARHAGATRILATAGAVTGSASLTVSALPVGRVVLKPAALSLVVGASAPLVATAEDSAGHALAGRVATFATSNPLVATVADDGRVTAMSSGTTTIVATIDGRMASAPVTVSAAPVANVELVPRKAVLIAGHSVQLAPRLWDERGNLVTGRVAGYASNDPGVATVTSEGVMTAVAPGRTAVMATVEGKRGAVDVEVIPAGRQTWARFESDYGEWVGRGEAHEYSTEYSIIVLSTAGARLRLNVTGAERWRVDLGMPRRYDRFVAGAHFTAPGTPSLAPDSGWMSVVRDGQGCETPAGSVTVDSVAYTDTVLTAIDLHLDQHCAPYTSATRAVIHWRGNETPTPPGPVFPMPAGLWTPPAGVLPASGNYVYLESEPGDFVGDGQNYLYTRADALMGVNTVSLANDEGHATVAVVRGGDWWHGDFQAMAGQHELRVGYYGNLLRYPFHDPRYGGMDWVTSRGCDAVAGWFAVDSIAYANETITALDLRFSQHCEGALPALRGAIHWRAPATSASPPAAAPPVRVRRGPGQSSDRGHGRPRRH